MTVFQIPKNVPDHVQAKQTVGIGLRLAKFSALTAVTVLAALSWPAPADAKKKKQPEIVPCPIDGPLRVANAQSVAGLKVLEGCTSQLVDSPPDPPRDIEDVIEIEGGNESPYITNMDQARPQKRKTRRAGGQSQAESDNTYILTSAGGVRSVRIVPEKEEQAYTSTTSYPTEVAAQSAGGSIKNNPEAILGLRPGTYSTRFDNLIEQVARRHRIDPLFLHAVIKQESGYRPAIGSHAGAVGLMQIMPATGRGLGLHPSQRTDPAANVDAGARLLRKLHKRYNGDFTLVLAAYNAGEGAVQRYGNRVPPFRETQHYVKAIMAHYSKLVATARPSGATQAP